MIILLRNKGGLSYMYYLVGAGLGSMICVTTLGLLLYGLSLRNGDGVLDITLLWAICYGTPWGILLGLTTAKMIKKESAIVLQNKSRLSVLVLLYFIAGIIGSIGAFRGYYWAWYYLFYVRLSPVAEVPDSCIPDILCAFLGGVLSILLVRKIRTRFWHNVPTDRSA